MADASKKKLRKTTVVYWVLLVYIISALIWWFFSLYTHNREMFLIRKEVLSGKYDPGSVIYQEEFAKIDEQRKRDNAKYISEGATFLILILIGAVFIYRSVRRQFKIQQQQQNFVMAITHELKTPLSVTRLNLETLQRHNLDDSKKEKLVHMTLQETLRLDNLINNILVSSQLEGQSYHIAKEELNFSDLVSDVAQHFSNRYPNRELQLNCEPDIDIHGDPILLKLLVSNLLENANKYSPLSRPVKLDLFASGKQIRLKVSDEGNGIADEDKKHVFTKFYRIGNEQTRTTKGTGLGLFLCKKISADHNGKIHVEDNHPQGTTFTVVFSLNH